MFGLDRVGFKMGRIEFGSIWVSSGQFESIWVSSGQFGSIRVCWNRVSSGQFGSIRVSSGRLKSGQFGSICFFFFFKNPIRYSDRVGFDPNQSQPDRVCKFQTDRVSIPTRSDPNPKFIGSGRVGSGKMPTPTLYNGAFRKGICIIMCYYLLEINKHHRKLGQIITDF